LKLGQEGARIDERVTAVNVEIERLSVTEFLERDRRCARPVALRDRVRAARRDRAHGFAKQSCSLI
jgi:hypothetical protein